MMNQFLELIIKYLHLRGIWYRLKCLIVIKGVLPWRYQKQLCRIRHKVSRGEKVKVLFIVDNTSKWKCQSLFEELAKKSVFEPMMGLSLRNFRDDEDACKKKLHEDRRFYEGLGNRCVNLEENDDLNPLEEIKPDIVFFQEPWGFDSGFLCVTEVSRHALTFYVPYSVEFDDAKCGRYSMDFFHNRLFCNIAWNMEQARYMKRFIPFYNRSGKIVGLGHPIFDQLNKGDEEPEGYVIYAPHFSFPLQEAERILTISTFLDTGVYILEYAKRHPEIKWLFKPHPLLRDELIKRGVWTEKMVNNYYSEWEKIGASCYDGDYFKLFRKSKAMITDCSSFLLEFPATGNPLIRMVPPENNANVRESVRPFINTLYTTYDIVQLEAALDKVIVRGVDERREDRIIEMKNLDMIGNNAAQKIVNFITSMLF